MAQIKKRKRYKSKKERYEQNLKRLQIAKKIFYFVLVAAIIWGIKNYIGYSQ